MKMNNKRVALCFYGLVGSKIGKNGNGESLDPTIAYEYYKKHILDVNDNVDVFIHSWSYDSKKKLLKLYKPKKEAIEKQREFSQSASHPKKLNIKGIKSKIKLLYLKLFNGTKYDAWLDSREKETFRAYSRWYSSKKVIDLKSEYEKENNFKYDVVMVTRLDIGFFNDVIFDKYDMNYFYASHRNDSSTKEMNYQANYENHYEGIEFQDFWFFSNSEIMDKFALLFDIIENYEISPHRSSRQHVDKVIGKEKVKYTLYRWFDHEMIRRKFFEAHE